jgi:hypothetical protein
MLARECVTRVWVAVLFGGLYAVIFLPLPVLFKLPVCFACDDWVRYLGCRGFRCILSLN